MYCRGLETDKDAEAFLSQVTNPLSVKTKVHTPRSPSALLSRSEREKTFLEVHIQNLTQEPMWFERMLFEPAQGWQVEDANVLPITENETGTQSLFTGSQALMQPQDIRQYMYILAATTLPTFAVQHAPGSVIPLGRLDISWRSSFGEPGRLLTSVSIQNRRFQVFSVTHVLIADALSSYTCTSGPGPTPSASICSSSVSSTQFHRHCQRTSHQPFSSWFTIQHTAGRFHWCSCALSPEFAFQEPAYVCSSATTEPSDNVWSRRKRIGSCRRRPH